MTSMTQGRSVRAAITAIAVIFVMAHSLGAQERGNKLRISQRRFYYHRVAASGGQGMGHVCR